MAKKRLSPLRLIRIAKNMDAKEMANYFEISSPYISSMENGNRKVNEEILIRGLTNLGIEPRDYKELEEFCSDLTDSDLEYQDQYRFALIKALGTVSPALKAETETLLNMCLLPNTIEITTYIKMAQEYEVLEVNGSLLITPKISDDQESFKSNKFTSLKRLGINIKEYQDLEATFKEITKSKPKEESKCKLLATLGILHPKSKPAIAIMLNKLLNGEPNKVKHI